MMNSYAKPPRKLKRLVGLLMEEFEGEFRRIASEKTNREDARENLTWVLKEKCLNLTYKQGKLLLPGNPLTSPTECRWQEKIEGYLESKEWLALKADVWRRWEEILREKHVTTEEEIITPIRGYWRRLKEGDFETGEGERINQPAIQMALGFMQLRGIGAAEARKKLGESVGGIPKHFLFMLFNPPEERTLLERSTRNAEQNMVKNAKAADKEGLLDDKILPDGLDIRARDEDGDAYIVEKPHGKNVHGYKTLIIRSGSGFPLMGDVAEAEESNEKETVKKKEKSGTSGSNSST